jgi:hypothetical protein
VSASHKEISNRGFGRRRSLLHAVVEMERRSAVRCLVRHIDESGAVIEFGGPIVLQSRFRLFWVELGVGADCEVRQTDGANVTVGFTTPDGPAIARRYAGDQSRAPVGTSALVPPPPRGIVDPYGKNMGADLVQRLRGSRLAGSGKRDPR